MVNQKFSKLTGPQTKVMAKVMANLDEAVPVLATDEVPFLQGGVAKKVDIANLVDGMTGTVTATGLDNADGVLTVDIAGLDAKVTPIAADSVMLCDSEATNALKEVTLTNLAKPLADVMAGTASATGLTDASGVLTVDIAGLDAKVTPIAADSVMLCDSADENALKEATLTNLAKPLADIMAGTATATGLKDASGVLTVDIAGLDPKTEPVAADSVAICDSENTNALKEVTITNLAKPLAGVMAGVAETTGLSDTTGVLTVAAKIAHLEDALLKGCTTVPMSFETGEQTTTKIYFPMKVTINKIRGIVMKAVADKDDGTITCGNSTGASDNGVITATASDALNTEYSVLPTTNNVVLGDDYYSLTSAKTTPGGKVLVSLEWTVTA